MAWWTRKDLEEAGLTDAQVTSVLIGSLKRRTRTRRFWKDGQEFSVPVVEAWIPKEVPLSAAVFAGEARRTLR
jgi:hypothetical protein